MYVCMYGILLFPWSLGPRMILASPSAAAGGPRFGGGPGGASLSLDEALDVGYPEL